MRQDWTAGDFVSRSKAKAKPQGRNSASSSTRTFPIGKRTWTDVDPGESSLSDYEISKKLIHLLRHGKHVHREHDGAVQFWRIEDNLQKHFLYCPHWSDGKWKKAWQEEEETRKDTRTVLILQEHLCISELFKDIQVAILLILHHRTTCLFRTISSSTFIMSDVQSVYTPSQIQDSYREDEIWTADRQCSFCLWIQWTKTTRILMWSTWVCHVMHSYLHNAWKRHQDAVYWVDFKSCYSKKKIDILSDSIELQSSFMKHFQLTVFRKLSGWKLEKSITKKYTCRLGLKPKTSLKHDWKRELGSEHAQRPERQNKVAQTV